MITREDFLKPQPLKTIDIEVEGMGPVRLMQLTSAEAAKYYAWQMPNGKHNPDRSALRNLKLLTLSVVNERGELLLEESDITMLKQQPAIVIDNLAYEAMVLNGMLAPEPVQSLLGKSDS